MVLEIGFTELGLEPKKVRMIGIQSDYTGQFILKENKIGEMNKTSY